MVVYTFNSSTRDTEVGELLFMIRLGYSRALFNFESRSQCVSLADLKLGDPPASWKILFQKKKKNPIKNKQINENRLSLCKLVKV